MTTPMTVEQFKAALPPQVRKNVNQALIDSINNTLKNPETREMFRDNLITYASVMAQGKFKMSSYISAVKYVSFKLLGATNKLAYMKTFPQKYADMVRRGVAEKDIASYSTAYNKSKLVNLIFEQTLVPLHVLNAPVLQDAINIQAELMFTAKSEMVRSNAANSLMIHLKPPENTKVELDISDHAGAIIDDYREAMLKMVEAQQDLIKQGGNLKSITNAPIRKIDLDKDKI